MTDITKFKNVSLSKTIEYLVEKEIKKVNKGKPNGKGQKD